MGAPQFGNKEAWTTVTAKGLEKVYNNAINGINGMPPKGGVSDLTDVQLKKVVDYMISESK
jgi:cytochrome c